MCVCVCARARTQDKIGLPLFFVATAHGGCHVGSCCLQRALAIDAVCPAAYFVLGAVCAQTYEEAEDAFDKAIADYDAAEKAGGKRAPWLYGRGLAKRALHENADAKADIDAALKLDPKIAETFRSYGVP